MNQVSAVFGAFMTIFYIGIGLYIAFTDDLNLDKFVKGLFGFTFTLYGIYRGFRSYQKIREAFFSGNEDNGTE
jgi:hypothetical protein